MWNKNEMKGHMQMQNQIEDLQAKCRDHIKARNFSAALEKVQLIVDQ
jgi:hypothetical protein